MFNQVIVERDFSGSFIPSIPKHNLAMNLSLSHRFNPAFTGFTRFGQRYISSLYVDDQNSDKTESYQLFNFTTGADLVVGDYNLLFSAGLNNIFDVDHVAFVNINSADARFFEAVNPDTFFSA